MSEEISMDVLKAVVLALDDKYIMEIRFGDFIASIPLSEDKPNEVKAAFNKLIVRLKGGPFQIELDDCGEDLFSQVSKEYLVQLNREIKEVYGEMKSNGLLNV